MPKKGYIFLLVFIIFAIAVIVGFFFRNGLMYFYNVERNPAFLYSENQSPDGRDLYYRDIFKTRVTQFSGVGYFPNSNLKSTWYIVGNFDRWEAIEDTTDRYLYLKNNLEGNGGLEIPKIRVGFHENSSPNNTEKQNFTSVLAIEDLSSIFPQVKDPELGVQYDYLGRFYSFTGSNDLEKLIIPGDVIAVKVYKDLYDNDITDLNGVIVADTIFIRRFNIQETLEQFKRPN